MQSQKKNWDYDTAISRMKKWENFYYDCDDGEQKEMVGNWLGRKQLGVALKKHWQLFREKNEERRLMYTICVNYTHISQDLCEHFGSSGFLQVLLSELKLFTIESEDLFDLEHILTIIYNCSKNPLNTKFFRGQDVINAIYSFASIKDTTIKMLAALTFFYGSSDDVNQAIRVDDQVIDSIALHLRNSLENDQHTSGGWSTEELVSAIKHIASNDINSLVRADFVELLNDVMTKGSESEKEVSKDALWMLSYNENFKKWFVDDEGSKEVVSHLSEDTRYQPQNI